MNYENTTAEERARANEMRRRSYAQSALKYDKKIGFCERRLVGTEHRPWACSRAHGRTLEVAIGTGLNLPHYPEDVELVGLDLTREMLALAAARARDLGRAVELEEGDAQELPFEDGSFDTVLCTFSLCGIPDVERAVAEMRRVLKPGGDLILVDHVKSSSKPVYWLQRAIESVTKRIEGEHMTRRPVIQVERTDLEIRERERSHAGVIERLVATKPVV
jgi:ubiquinone/menaquinone biosynthesis C-methylase UbiE